MTHLLTWILFLPLVGALLLTFLPRSLGFLARPLGVLLSCLPLCLGISALKNFDSDLSSLQMVERYPWMIKFGIQYDIGLDGWNLPLVLLTLLITPVALLGTWHISSSHNYSKQKLIASLVLAMETGALGTFLSQDLLLFYVFWEVVLIPAYILIGMYGTEDRRRTTLQFFLYTFAGSLALFFGILWLLWQQKVQAGFPSAAISDLMKLQLNFDANCCFGLFSSQGLLFLLIGAGFFVKAPLLFFHGWLFNTYKNAPTVVSVYLAAILSKMGVYGVGKILLPLFPHAAVAFSETLMWLAAIGVIYGAMMALVQNNFKSVIAFSSLSHISSILLGLFSLNALATNGALFQMVQHGIIIAGLFIVAGILEKRHGSSDFEKLGGLAKTSPLLTISLFILTLGSIGLPGSSGFVGEFTILAGSFQKAIGPGMLATTGVILSAAYMLYAFQKTMLGSRQAIYKSSEKDLSFPEGAVFAVLIGAVIVLGILPQMELYLSESTIESYLAIFQKR